ncbi:DNA repair and recombination protein RAD54B-like [Dendronephthya gigantea]|uniref:DNA repair and recombination protein RAD54B-like n=1 Tax=Dendronephthya gigantea TaxID=151771 RepID=UPI00106900EA|nr:DNA repair and recombination protein RAD54B-like [Dendronephthya gigantea]
MRRSAAPSQNPNGKKRQRILPNNGLESEDSPAKIFRQDDLESISNKLCTEDKQKVNKENQCLPMRPNSPKVHIPKFKPKISSFRTPVRGTGLTVSTTASETKNEDNSTNDISRYYNVMWCKISKKKHKTWEGDGILVTKERTAILQDTEGKEIGRARGYKADELAKFTEGQTLLIGGKEVEITGELQKDVYLSGRCFQQGSEAKTTPPKNYSFTKSVVPKPFLNPQKAGSTPGNQELSSLNKRKITPRFDPLAPGALVMPRPSASHQFENNKKDLSVIDVVVDPYISKILRPHQREGVTFLYECVMGLRSFVGNGAILADDMGLGKTLQCISLVWTLFKQGMYGGQPIAKRFLIITPGSLVKNWAAEFRKWLGNERMPVYTVNSEKKVQEFIHSPVFPAMVISYEMFVRYVEDIRKITFDLVICDEAHRLKNAAIKTSMHISSLKVQRKVLLTGTPIQNDLTEFYSLADFCNPGIFGTQASFRRVYEEPIVRGRQPGATAEEKEIGESRACELNRLTSQFLLRRTSEINNKYLPRKVESVVFCRASHLQLQLYQHLTSSRWFKSCLSSSYASSLHLMCISALKKLCNHPCLLYRRNATEQVEKQHLTDAESLYDDLQAYYPPDIDPNSSDHSGKLKVLDNLLGKICANNPAERVVVVSNYTQTLNVIQGLCQKRGYRFLRLDGQTATNDRQSLVERFNRKGSQDFVFLLSSKAGGVGLNLTGGSILLLYDIDWNPANDIQAMARVWRDGQKKTVKIYRLLTTGTIEEKIYQRQISKQGLSGAVADSNISSKPQDFSREDLKDLFTLHTKTTCLTHDLLNCSCIETRTEM